MRGYLDQASIIPELRRLLKHTSIYGLSNVVGKAIGFLMIPVYTRFIPPHDYGVLEILDVTVNILGIFVGIGISSAVARFYYQYQSPKDRDEIISSALLFLTVIAFAVSAAGCGLSDLISSLLFETNRYSFYLKIVFATLAFNTILEIPLTYIRAMERSAVFSMIAIVRLIVSLSLNIFFVVFMEMGILGILYSGIITATVFSMVLGIATLWKAGISPSLDKLSLMIRFGAPLLLHMVGMFVINWGDRYVLNASAGLQEVGIYALGYKFGFMVTVLLGQPFFMIWSVRRYSLIQEQDGENTYGGVFFVYFTILIFFWLFLAIFAREIIAVAADRQYHAAYTILPLVSLGYVFRECADFLNGILYIHKKTSRIGFISLGVALYCILNYLLLIPPFGGLGAGIATLSTFCFMAFVTWYSAERVRHIDYRLAKCFIAFFVAVFLWCAAIVSSRFLGVYAAIGLKTVLWFTFPVLSFFLLLQSAERRAILSWLPAPTVHPASGDHT